jgi:hypothetical protein
MHKVGLFVTLLITIMVLAIAAPAEAHSPLFPQENHSIDTAMIIEDPAKSFAVYHELESEEAAYYQFDMKAGDRIFVQVLVPVSPEEGFVPNLALLVPSTGSNEGLPSFVEVPEGYHSIVSPGDPAAEGELEPFTPGPIFILAEIDVEAPESGTYYAVVYSNDQAGNYAFVIGYLEGFTAGEILSLPLNLLTIYQWEGQQLWVALLPYILVFALGLAFAYYGFRRMGKPDSWVKWLAVISSLAFIGSTVNVIAQLAFSFTRVPVSSLMVLSLLFAVAYLVMGLVLGRFAYKRKELSIGLRIAFAAIGIIGLTMWGGFYIGPILALVIALAPPYKRSK